MVFLGIMFRYYFYFKPIEFQIIGENNEISILILMILGINFLNEITYEFIIKESSDKIKFFYSYFNYFLNCFLYPLILGFFISFIILKK